MDPRELLDDLHRSIEEERLENPKIANHLDKMIRFYNRHWIIDNKNTLIPRDTGKEESVIDILIATRFQQLSNTIDLNDDETFTDLFKVVNTRMNNLLLTEAASDPINDELIELKDGTKVDFYENFEYVIAQYDKEYPKQLEEELMETYERSLKHKNSKIINAGELTERDKEKLEEIHNKNEVVKKEKRKNILERMGIIEYISEDEEKEPEKVEVAATVSEPEPVETEEINSLNEWALELGHYIVNERNKLVRR